MRFVVQGVALCVFGAVAGCQGKENHASADFALGSANDPVVKQALTTSTTMSTLKVTITNTSGRDVKEGLITLAPLFTVGQTASAAVAGYVLDTSSNAGNVSPLVRAAGLVLNVNAFKVGSLGKGKSMTVTITVPTGSTLYYLGRVDGSSADFVAVANIESGGALAGYKISGGVVLGGNASTGATAGTSSAIDLAACAGSAAMTTVTSLFSDEMALAAYDKNWPMSAGYDAEFNGEWFTDGVSARLWTQGGSAPLGAVTGFVKFLAICPVSGATISLEADVDTAQYSATASDTTLHIYYFDAANALIKIDYNYPLPKGSLRRIGLYDSVVPPTARKIALVPMARFDNAEQSTVFYHNLVANYEPAGSVKNTSLASDDFSLFNATTKQPNGWAEFNGDWYVIPANKFVTLWNSAWGGDQTTLPPFDTGISKSFSLGTVLAGDRLNATLFTASTFTDASSYVRLRLLFDDGTVVESDRTGGSTYNELYLRRIAVPLTAKNVTVVVNAYLGATETSSLYADDLRLSLVR